jgi:thiol-disulfide isomerase/thioredoxin
VTKKATARKTRRGKPAQSNKSTGALASLVAAGASVLMLAGLLYASCRDTSSNPVAEPVQAPAPVVTAPVATAPIATTVAAPSPAPTAPKTQKEDWNDANIAWQTYEAGLARAKKENKPVCLVFFTNWCPHCRNYSRVFSDPRIVTRAKDFVMIRLNGDEVPEISAAHSPDGGYVPRTFFLSSEGKILADVHAQRPKYVHFYDESNPESLLGGMDSALKKIRAM